MKSWADVKMSITSIDQSDKQFLETLAGIVSKLINGRLDKNLTQAEVAERTGLKQSAISRLENANGYPTIETIFKVANALDYEITLVKRVDNEINNKKN